MAEVDRQETTNLELLGTGVSCFLDEAYVTKLKAYPKQELAEM
jgi:hypothetical protein